MKKKTGWFLLALLALCAAGFAAGKPRTALPAEMLNPRDSFALKVELVGAIPRTEGFRILQGGCVTEKYAWFAMVSEDQFSDWEKSQCYIIRYDRATMKETGRSLPLSLGHANDITYLPATNELYVVHCYRRMISVLDADTLTVKEVKHTDDTYKFDLYAIAYNEKRNGFVTAMNQAAMILYDADWKVTGTALPQKTNLVTQGICADDRYVYHILYDADPDAEEKENIILAVEWKGNEIARLPLGLSDVEPENISLVGDTFYIGCNNSTWTGGLVYTAKLVKK